MGLFEFRLIVGVWHLATIVAALFTSLSLSRSRGCNCSCKAKQSKAEYYSPLSAKSETVKANSVIPFQSHAHADNYLNNALRVPSCY